MKSADVLSRMWTSSTGGEKTKMQRHTKSRNGCTTCKLRRRKCDEAKPSCSQCTRRRVVCGGYRKDLRWKEFTQTDLFSSTSSTGTLGATLAMKEALSSPSDLFLSSSSASSREKKRSRFGDGEEGLERLEVDPFCGMEDSHDAQEAQEAQEAADPADMTEIADITGFDLFFDDPPFPADSQHSSHLFQSLSPDASERVLEHPALCGLQTLQATDGRPQPDLDSEEVKYRRMKEDRTWEESLPDEDLDLAVAPLPSADALAPGFLLPQPALAKGGPEHIAVLFNRRICNVLCIYDGISGNPWCEIVWSLAQNHAALYHSIAAMTCFQKDNRLPHLRARGLEHLNKSIELLYDAYSGIMQSTGETRGGGGGGDRGAQLEVALAATLTLGFAETWYYPRSSTGIRFIKSAKKLLKRALSQYRLDQHESGPSGPLGPSGPRIVPPRGRQTPMQPDRMDASHLRFLANTWIYMDVISRFTCRDIQALDTRFLTTCRLLNDQVRGPFHSDAPIDPLMGVAETLFPLIGRVADLARRVRETVSVDGHDQNPPSVVAEAVELEREIKQWFPPLPAVVEQKNRLATPNPFSCDSSFGSSSSSSSSPSSSSSSTSATASDLVQTSNAYKWSILLLLYQAVPELPRALSQSRLTRTVLVLLATVPLSSRAVIFPVLPLLLAGCEATDAEDREWVRSRWYALSTTNSSGIVDRCLELTMEVWRRRDSRERDCTLNAFEADMQSALAFEPESSSLDSFEPSFQEAGVHAHPRHEYTVKSPEHWLNVVRDWGWEVMLG